MNRSPDDHEEEEESEHENLQNLAPKSKLTKEQELHERFAHYEKLRISAE